MLGRVLLNGSNKKWIFKKGKFYITPLINSWNIVNDKLKSNGKLVIPYDVKNENVFIKYNIPYSTEFGFCFSTKVSSYTGATNYKQDDTITGATLNTLNRRTFHIKSIWLEKVGG